MSGLIAWTSAGTLLLNWWRSGTAEVPLSCSLGHLGEVVVAMLHVACLPLDSILRLDVSGVALELAVRRGAKCVVAFVSISNVGDDAVPIPLALRSLASRWVHARIMRHHQDLVAKQCALDAVSRDESNFDTKQIMSDDPNKQLQARFTEVSSHSELKDLEDYVTDLVGCLTLMMDKCCLGANFTIAPFNEELQTIQVAYDLPLQVVHKAALACARPCFAPTVSFKRSSPVVAVINDAEGAEHSAVICPFPERHPAYYISALLHGAKSPAFPLRAPNLPVAVAELDPTTHFALLARVSELFIPVLMRLQVVAEEDAPQVNGPQPSATISAPTSTSPIDNSNPLAPSHITR